MEIFYIGTPYALGILLIAVMGLSGYWTMHHVYNRQQNRSHLNPSETAHTINVETPDAVAQLLANYPEQQGGAEIWNRLQSVEYNGIIFDQQQHHSFAAAASKDGSFTLRVVNRNSETEISLNDGKIHWQDTLNAQPDTAAPYILSITRLIRELYNPLMELSISQSGKLLSLKETDLNGMPVLLASIEHETITSDLYLYKTDLTLVRRVDTYSDGSQQTFRFSAYRTINGLKIPTMVLAENNAGEVSNIRFTEITPRTGPTQSAEASDERPTQLLTSAYTLQSAKQ